ncbi:MAG: hypothetical protein FOGNACKC_00814 [Anaerolineae bacterium]|nr:hypothetical protein [Anaerolineae bacterium]
MVECPGCGKKMTNKAYNEPVKTPDGRTVIGAHECPHCRALFGEMYKGESYSLVKPWLTGADVPPDKWRYYDFQVLGSNGVERRHGWFDPETRLILQVG